MPKIPGLTAADLAPGDARSANFDLDPLDFHFIRDSTDPWFDAGYDVLWDEFGQKHEMENREVILQRLRRRPAETGDGFSFRYEMAVITDSEEKIAAVRDHTVILCHGNTTQSSKVPPRQGSSAQNDFPTENLQLNTSFAVAHLSHIWINPEWRRSGLTGWLRALPIVTIRKALKEAGLPPDTATTLAGEMEHPTPGNVEQMVRLKAYEKARYCKADPKQILYHQPDFRSPDEIDASGGPKPLPMALILRRVGRESETAAPAAEIRAIVESLYRMYAQEFRPQDMAAVYEILKRYPQGETAVALMPPTQNS
jgi:hypothetical protein